jgi:peptidyl-prolyl cis-trans isomerase A (cyclophilin A)
MRLNLLLLISVILTSLACSSPGHKGFHVEIRTRLGDIQVELYPDKAPKSVAAFLSNVDAGYYKDGSFYRVLNMDNQPSNAPKAELVQGGIWKKRNKPGSIARIPHESTKQTGILHTDGVISFARLEPGTAGTEFFICIGDQPGFDHGGENNPDGEGYAAFGKVINGMDIVRKIYRQPEQDQYFQKEIAIYNIVRKL